MKRFLVIFMLITLLFTHTSSLALASEKTKKTEASTEDTADENTLQWPKWPSGKKISAESAIVMELSTGLILYKKNIHKKQYPASITKIMTTLLCLENSSLGETVTFSHDAIYGIERDSSHIGIDVGEQLTMEQCLYGIMLESANEVSLGVAEHVAGDFSSFADMMNAKAKELGCKDTHFSNPNGLHDDNHYTSAYDMALIAKAAMQNSTFRKITGTKRYTIPPTNKQKETRYLRNHQQMLNPYKYPQYEYDYCNGGKTGYTTKAAATLVSFGEMDGMQVVCVVMRASSPPLEPNLYTDSIDLLNFSFENYKRYTISGNSEEKDISSTPFFTKYNYLFNSTSSPLQMSGNASVVLPADANYEDAKRTIEYYPDVSLKNGKNIIGNISYTYDGKLVGSSDIIFNKVSSPKLASYIPVLEKVEGEKCSTAGQNLPLIILITLLALAVIAFLVYFFLIRPKKLGGGNYRNRKQTKETFDNSFTDFKL